VTPRIYRPLRLAACFALAAAPACKRPAPEVPARAQTPAPPAPLAEKVDTANATDSVAMAPWLAIDYTKDSVRMSDLAILTDEQRPLVRGIVFGRHGRVFKDEEIQDWLTSQPWYHARPEFNNSELNDVERKNLDVIRAAETLGHPSIELGDMRFYKDRSITREQLAGRSLTELRVLAAEIEAEHGRRFDDDPWLASYFAGRYWYHPADTYDPSSLSDVERANLGVINGTMKHDRRLALAPGDMEHYQRTEITETMLHGLGLNELRILRNEVYARRGRHYDGGGWLARYFEIQDWYQPSADTTPPVLSDVEDHNVRVIVAYENRLHEALVSQPIDTTLLEGLFLEDARKLRYEIYARHGKVFPQRRLQTYFASFAWYHANLRWVDTDLSALERRNAELILAYEKGAMRTIDAFEG
jgi:hypothetical protein